MALSWTPLWAQSVSDNAASDDEVVRLSPFEVESDKDYGYLKTNSATATRIGMAIQQVPMNVSVQSREFLDDTNSNSLTDLFRYTAAASGDNRFAMRRPANEATPQGEFTLRGFKVNTLLRNGIFRYISYNLDNVERVEIVSGPASVFFGQGYPGGVMNFITKKPSFGKIPTTFTYKLDDNSGQKFILDHNAVLSKKAAFRVVGAWADLQGERRFEFRDNINITPSLTLIPFESGKVEINIEAEYLAEKFNQNDYDWVYGDAAGWRQWVAEGGANAANNFATYINSIRAATGDWDLPTYTSIERGAYITDINGNRVHDEAFNYTSRGAYTENVVKAFSTTVDIRPFDWLNVRYSYVRERADYNSLEGMTLPYGDGIHWSVGASSTAGYYRNTENHQLDVIFDLPEFFSIKNKLLTGVNFNKYEQKYNANDPSLFPFYGHVPGATNAIANPNWSQVPQNLAGSGGQVPVNQVIRDRDGNIKLVKEVYTYWDPGFELNPSIATLDKGDRVLLDQYKPETDAWYVNWQASAFDDRLTVMAGYRNEKRGGNGQYLIGNYPWFIPPPDATNDTVTYPPNVYGYDYGYHRGEFLSPELEGDSDMIGVSYALTKNINLYASHSNTFKFNSGFAGGALPESVSLWAAAALDHGGGSFQYLGQTITSAEQLYNALASRGAFDTVPNETGENLEFGVKVSSEDNKYVGTFSIFRGTRTNERVDDTAKQANLEEPLNYSTTLFDSSSPYYNTRLLRWRTVNLENRIEGATAELIWTPTRNLQSVISGSWLWTAKTVYDMTRPKPGTPEFEAGTPAQQVAWNIWYNSRIENVPEYKLTSFTKYTFTDGPVRGLSLGLGIRYSSETVISRSVDFNPLNGGLMGGDYVVFDVTVGYPWEFAGYKFKTQFGVYNVTDEVYMEGRTALSPARNWVLSNTLSF